MRALVTLLTSFILALGLLGAGLTLLHGIPQKTPPTDPGFQWTIPDGLEVMPRPIEAMVERASPREASFAGANASSKGANRGSLQLSGQIQLSVEQVPPDEGIGLKLLREDGEVGLFLRRLDLGKQRSFRFEGLAPGTYRLQVHVSKSGHTLKSLEIRLDKDRHLTLGPEAPRPAQELRFSPWLGSLEEGALLVIEDGRFFHQRIRGKAGGQFLAKDLPPGSLRYTLRGRLSPKAHHSTWKGVLTVLPARGTQAQPIEIRLPDQESKDTSR